MKGFILLYKQIMDWGWYSDSNTMRLFIHCLLKANYSDNEWKGVSLKRGQFITSTKKLSAALDISERQVRTSLNKLVKTGEIIKKTTNKYTLIEVTNYSYYQDYKRFVKNNGGKQKVTQKSCESQTKVIQMSTTKEEKEKSKNNKEKKEERSAHIFLKQDKVFWKKFISKYKNQIPEFEKMLQKFDLKMREENFPFVKEKLQARVERYALSWVENQSKFKSINSKFKPHR